MGNNETKEVFLNFRHIMSTTVEIMVSLGYTNDDIIEAISNLLNWKWTRQLYEKR
jgi:hypothetical protein